MEQNRKPSECSTYLKIIFPSTLKMHRYYWNSFLLLALYCLRSNAKEDSYRAAVLELGQFTNTSYEAREILKINLKVYEQAAAVARDNDVDIIVYPESGLYPFEKPNREWLAGFIEDIPDPKIAQVNPCIETMKFKNLPILTKLSCLARENNLYLVANVADSKKCYPCDSDTCNKCPDDGRYFFNTNVVFSRDGTLIAKYYKRHLYFEPEMNVPPFPENTYFETEFGNFTTLICFDLIFEDSVKAIEKPGALNVAYPTYWFDHTPMFFFAVPYQLAWATANNVNLLAANGHYAMTGSLGSGIYSGDIGALVYTNNPDGRGKLLISNVPQDPRIIRNNSFTPDVKRIILENGEIIYNNDEERNDFKDTCDVNVLPDVTEDSPLNEYRCKNTDISHYKFKKLEKRSDLLELCNEGFCCSLKYEAESMNENYYLGVSGLEVNFYDINYFGVQSCFLARCEDFDNRSCNNYLLRAQTPFKEVYLQGNFSTKHVFPFILESEVQFPERSSWLFDGKSKIEYQNSRYSEDKTHSLIFLGMHGRVFNLDRPVPKKDHNSGHTSFLSVLSIVFACVCSALILI